MSRTNGIIHAGLLAAFLLAANSVLAQGTSPIATAAQGAGGDQAFLKQALGVNQLELELGRLAADRASTSEVKEMGRKMVQKHSEFGRQLSDLAKQLGGSGDAKMSPEQSETYSRVRSESGRDFDTAFKQTVDAGHVKELAMYQQEAGRAASPQLRALAERRVATLQQSMASPTAATSKSATH